MGENEDMKFNRNRFVDVSCYIIEMVVSIIFLFLIIIVGVIAISSWCDSLPVSQAEITGEVERGPGR